MAKTEGQVGPGLPVLKGQLMLKTVCDRCGARFSNPTGAAVHVVRQHQPISLRASEGKSLWGVRWGPDGSLREVIRGPNPSNNGGKTDPDAVPAPSETTDSSGPYIALVWRLQPHRCVWCGLSLTRGEAQGHHITPRTEGGGDQPSNLWIVHGEKCHDEIEEWTQKHDRAPGADDIIAARKFGYVSRFPE